MRLLVFSLGDQRHALHVEAVERVLRAVQVTPLVDAPAGVLGIIHLYGRVVPVFGLRTGLGLPGKAVEPGDQLVIAQVAGRQVGLLVDAVHGVAECDAQQETFAESILPGLRRMEGAIRLGGETVIVDDLAGICSPALAELAELAVGTA